MSRSRVSKCKTVRSQLESDVRIQKRLAATAQKSQSELTKLKNELDKKAKDSGAGDKPNSEYRMLLSEKDALIAEYLSGSDSKYTLSFHSIFVKKPVD